MRKVYLLSVLGFSLLAGCQFLVKHPDIVVDAEEAVEEAIDELIHPEKEIALEA